jgi:hypothetical protein
VFLSLRVADWEGIGGRTERLNGSGVETNFVDFASVRFVRFERR